MNKRELVAKVTQKAQVSKTDAEKIISAALETIIDEVASGNKVQLIGFGTFEQRVRKEKTVKVPNTDKLTTVPEAKIPVFKAGKIFKDTVNQ